MAKANFNCDKLFDEAGLKRFKQSYLQTGETSPQERFAYVCNFFSSNKEHAERMYTYVSNHWVSLSSPILTYLENKKNSFPISCYLCYLSDTLDSLLFTLAEVNTLSTKGGGVSIKFNLRSHSDKSSGVIQHIKTYDACSLAYKQTSRRGSYASYLDIDHPEILEFIELRKPTGDHNLRALNIHHAINVSEKFMKKLEHVLNNPNSKDTSWDLIDPHTKVVKKSVCIRNLWQKIIETRLNTGEPYLCFIDTCRALMNPFQKKQGMTINQSNLCSEIIVPTNKNRSSLCCLLSLNLDYYDTWRDTEKAPLLFDDIMLFLDNVLEEFIRKSAGKPYMHKIIASAKHEKNIGIGVLGFHSYLQSKLIDIESYQAKRVNKEIFSFIQKETSRVNRAMGKSHGEPKDIKGSGCHFAYCMAIAPTASTSILMGNTSPSIEPFRANIYRQDTLSGFTFNKNKHLDKLLREKNLSPAAMKKVWQHIVCNNGSVQKLPKGVLNENEKNVFKTFIEIDQMKLLQLAADRQKFIDQSQSLTFTFHPNENIKTIHDVHFQAWKLGIKTLYYCRSEKIAKASMLQDDPFESCQNCQS